MERVKNYFASANTGDGFVCNFDYICDQSKPYFQFIIKGGSGTGKSTMMKKIGKYFHQQGYNIEYFYCSSDHESLDGVRIVEKNISVIDGTAPHTFDANLLGVRNKIVDVGQFVKPEIKKQEAIILKNISQKKRCFDIAYAYLNSAKTLTEINKIISIENIDNSRINQIIKKIIKKIPLKTQKTHFFQRNLFLQSFSKGETVDLTEKNNYDKILQFECFESEKSFIFEGVLEELKKQNYEIKCFYDLICPNKISAIEVKNNLIRAKIIKNNEKINKKIEKNDIFIKKLINLAENYFFEAKKHHKNLERFYIKNMDFVGVEIATKNLIEVIEKM